jgi:hypothetical protein
MCRLSGRHEVYFIVVRRAVNMAEEWPGLDRPAAIDAVLVKPSRTNRHQGTEPGNRPKAEM